MSIFFRGAVQPAAVCAHAVDLFEQPHHLRDRYRVKIAGRLISEQECGLAGYGACNGDPLLLAAQTDM
jgi:hypothetical protein